MGCAKKSGTLRVIWSRLNGAWIVGGRGAARLGVTSEPHREINPVKGVINVLDNVIRRRQQHREDRRSGGASRDIHGGSECPGICGARFRRYAESACFRPGAAASGSTDQCTTTAATGPTVEW